MKEAFVPYKLAVNLKEKGFNEKCFTYYGFNKELKFGGPLVDWYVNKTMVTTQAAAPMYQQVIDWLDSKGCIIEIDFADTESSYGFQFTICLRGNYEYNDLDMRHSAKRIFNFKDYFETRNACYDKSIEEALKLI